MTRRHAAQLTQDTVSILGRVTDALRADRNRTPDPAGTRLAQLRRDLLILLEDASAAGTPVILDEAWQIAPARVPHAAQLIPITQHISDLGGDARIVLARAETERPNSLLGYGQLRTGISKPGRVRSHAQTRVGSLARSPQVRTYEEF